METTVLKQLADLQDMPYQALKVKWRGLYGKEPPAYKREHMIRRLAYRIQELAFGGFRPGVGRGGDCGAARG